LVDKADETGNTDMCDGEMEILIAEKAGFCLGVERALNMVLGTVMRKGVPLYTYGPLIHNAQVVEYLDSLGVKEVDRIEDIPIGGRVVIRSHGIGPTERKLMEERQLEIVDASCMFVMKAQHMTAELYEQGYKIIILGLKDHPEVKALRDFVNDEAIIVSNLDELPNFEHPPEKLGLICQTTLNTEFFEKAVEHLRKQVPNLVVRNTICDATEKRQRAARDIAGKVDAMVVIGGRHSSNTRKLTDICLDRGVDTYHIESIDELRPGWFLGRRRIGVTAGASTPDWLIEDLINAIEEFGFRKPQVTVTEAETLEEEVEGCQDA
jgi:small subunit ribosomal protein S1